MSALGVELQTALDGAVAEGIAPNVRRWLRFVGARQGDWIEAQALDVPERRGGRTSTRFAHAGDADTLVKLLTEADMWGAPGVYVIANRVNPAVATRKATGQWHTAYPRESTTDRDIQARAVFYVDVDVDRPSRTSASDAEVALAHATAVRIYSDLAAELGGREVLALGHSGNGRAIFVALEPTPEMQETTLRPLVSGLLCALKGLYASEGITIDPSVGDAKRLVPAFGTMKRKGSGQPPRPGEPLLRPHRRTAIVVPEQVRRVDVAALERLLHALRVRLTDAQNAEIDRAMGKRPAMAPRPTTGLRVDRPNPFEEAKTIPIDRVLAWLGLDGPRCPGCGTTGDSSVAIVENGLKCLHARCANRGAPGLPGFRTTIDVVMEARRCMDATEAVNLMATEFGFIGVRKRVPATVARSDAPAHDPAEDGDRGGELASAPPTVPAGQRSGSAHVPPQDLEAERALLSATIQSRAALEAVAHRIRPEHFYAPAGALVWAAELELLRAGEPVDRVTVTSLLRSRGQLERVGGAEVLYQLASEAPDVAHVEAYAATVRSKAKHRASLALLQRLVSEARGAIGDVNAWLDDVEEQIHAAAFDRADDGGLPTMRETLAEVFRGLESGDRDPGVRTGLVDLDALMGPMLPGQIIVVAAASGIGKTSLGMEWAVHAAREQVLARVDGTSQVITPAVLVFSLEMRCDELAMRALFSEARVDGAKVIHTTRITDREWDDLRKASRSVALPNIYLDDRGGLTPVQMRSQARRVQTQARRDGFSLRLILVDYVQLIDGAAEGRRPQERREREIAAVSIALKNMAKELGVPIVVLAQLNDDPRREKRLPRKEDLRECKAIGNDADKVILIHNPSAVARRQARRTREGLDDVLEGELVDLIVDKNRGAREGKVSVLFFPSYTLFANASPEDVARLAPPSSTEVHS
jgi:replicative DNA helicase